MKIASDIYFTMLIIIFKTMSYTNDRFRYPV